MRHLYIFYGRHDASFYLSFTRKILSLFLGFKAFVMPSATHIKSWTNIYIEKGFKPANVYAFASRTLPLIAVLMVAQHPVVVYADGSEEKEDFFTDEQTELLRFNNKRYPR